MTVKGLFSVKETAILQHYSPPTGGKRKGRANATHSYVFRNNGEYIFEVGFSQKSVMYLMCKKKTGSKMKLGEVHTILNFSKPESDWTEIQGTETGTTTNRMISYICKEPLLSADGKPTGLIKDMLFAHYRINRGILMVYTKDWTADVVSEFSKSFR